MSDHPELKVYLFPPDYTGGGTELEAIDGQAQFELSNVGSGSVRVPNGAYDDLFSVPEDRSILQWRALTNYLTDAYEVLGSTRIRRPQRVTVTEREGAEEVTTLAGAGILDDLRHTTVGPPNAPGVTPVGHELRFDWTSPLFAISGLDSAVERETAADTEPPPVGQWGRPQTWLTPSAHWVATGTATVDVDDPIGTWYLFRDFTLDDPAKVLLTAAVDDLFVMALDGTIVMDPVSSPGDSANDTWARTYDLPAGTHRIALKCENVPRLGLGNAAMALVGVYVEVLTGDGFDWDELLMSDDTWKVIPVGDDAPGFTVGYVVDYFRDAAATRGEPFADWTLNFDADEDSNNISWPKVPMRFDSKLDAIGALTQMRDAGLCEFFAAPDELALNMYQSGNAGHDRTATLSVIIPTESVDDIATVSHLEYDLDYNPVCTELEVVDGQGWFRVGTPGMRKSLDLSNVDDRTESTRIAERTLERFILPTQSIRLDWDAPAGELSPRPSAFWLGDIIDGRTLAGDRDPHRMMAVSIRFQNDRLVFTPELIDTRRDVLTRLAAITSATSPGLLGGRSDAVAPATARQPAPISLERWSERYSSSGKADEITEADDLTTGPITIERRTKLLHLSIAANDASTHGSTTVSVTVDGATVASVTLAAGSLAGSVAFEQSVFVGQVIKIFLGTRGNHTNVTGELSGAYLP